MTPTASRLKARLDERRRWFTNEWFYKWHFIGRDGPVSIDGFDGRQIQYCGIKFSGTARDVYWNAIVLGVKKEIIEQMAWVDDEVRKYKHETALLAIDECAGQLMSFVRSIRREATKKDRILRGDGVTFPPEEDAGFWHDTSDAVILSQADALKSALPVPTQAPPEPPVPVQTWGQRASGVWNNNQWWLGPVGIGLGILGVMPLIL